MVEKFFVTWDEVMYYVDSVQKKYGNKGLKGVYGIPRGGLVLGVLISHRMNIPLLAAPVEGCLIVDDICDTGESLIHYDKNSSSLNKPVYHLTTMFYREGACVTPEFFEHYKKDSWIVFPWEE